MNDDDDSNYIVCYCSMLDRWNKTGQTYTNPLLYINVQRQEIDRYDCARRSPRDEV